jgi:hypothetical protein
MESIIRISETSDERVLQRELLSSERWRNLKLAMATTALEEEADERRRIVPDQE